MNKNIDAESAASPMLQIIPGLSQLLKDQEQDEGIEESFALGDIPATNLFLILGPSGSGKSTYCREFLGESLRNNHQCILISGTMTERQFKGLFSTSLGPPSADQVSFLNPIFGIGVALESDNDSSSHDAKRLQITLKEIHKLLKNSSSQRDELERKNRDNHGLDSIAESTDYEKAPCLVLDSLTELFLLFDEPSVLRFVTELCLLLKQFGAYALLTLVTVPGLNPILPGKNPAHSASIDSGTAASYSASSSNQDSSPNPAATETVSSLSSLPSFLAPFFDAILETKLDRFERRKEVDGENKDHRVAVRSDSVIRSIRLLSAKGFPYHQPKWVKFVLTKEGRLKFEDTTSSSLSLTCTMCGKPVTGRPIMSSEFAFDSQSCVEAYHRLVGIYGPSISALGGLPSQVVNINFFFVDIVGLSNPALSVKRQIEKIEVLNNLIRSCEAFARTKEPIIVLPTGDGMAIGFYNNPESPLRLSIELQRKIRDYNNSNSNTEDFFENKEVSEENTLGVRIGLSSGPVFIVDDLKGNQNVWGPGIILARRVMDIGDNMHILISDNMASSLIALRDENRGVIKPIGEYAIKHGQVIKIYSAFSTEFGNSALPAKMKGT